MDNSDAIHIYDQSDNMQNRMESFLISCVCKLSDHDVLTAITFVTKYYPEDNQFMNKFSLSLANRLRRINVHQIIPMLEELKIFLLYNTINLSESLLFTLGKLKDCLLVQSLVAMESQLHVEANETDRQLDDAQQSNNEELTV
ncbi:unnamed protein product [Rotaria sordida]|uniref:Uncharacterized protein n=1 Tax=Rotaria sordida TaxID=392033 RepID=A0A818VYU2_9BILA|nr:unnamed protein product [Rotaria sordida]